MRKKIFWSSLAISLLVLFTTLLAVFVSLIYNTKLSAEDLLLDMLVPAVIITGGAVLLSFWLAAKLAKSITEPINRISLENPKSAAVYAELTPLVEKIASQNRRITEQMEKMTAEHERQDAMRRDFTANVSHELKTPLTSVSGYAELIQNGLVKPEDIGRFAGKIYDESRRLISLVGDIIRLSQLDSKEIAVTMESVDLYAVCEGVISHLEMAAAQKGVTFTLEGQPICIHSAEQVVEEIVYNLCDNAVKYNKPGGTVAIKLVQCVDGVELTVQDSGIGIAEHDLPHIFERFYRADKSHSKAIGGTGLGLSIVKHAAMFLGATVTAHSVLGEGTTIRVRF